MKFRPVSSRGLKTYSIKKRRSKVRVADFAGLPPVGSTMREFFAKLPRILGAKDLNSVVSAVVKAHKADKPVVIAIGGHVIKVGLAPLIIDLIERGVVNAVAMNGSCVVHDFEIAFVGATSEDVDAELSGGSFGMAEETGAMLNGAIKRFKRKGLGRAVGEMIERSSFKHKDLSILAACARNKIPATVHVALGTDILHIHPQMSGAATGEATMRDFRLFASVVGSLEGGVFINIGSAVLMPEVFLKALTLVRNKGSKVRTFTTVNMDFIQSYRSTVNVVKRPVTGAGAKGYALTGHHEIMVPLLYAAIIEALA
jgi:hypothetical protein